MPKKSQEFITKQRDSNAYLGVLGKAYKPSKQRITKIWQGLVGRTTTIINQRKAFVNRDFGSHYGKRMNLKTPTTKPLP